MKTLNTIQTLSKIGKVLSKIIYICCIIGAAGCVVGIVSLPFADTGILKIGGVTVYGLIVNHAGIDLNSLYPLMAGAMIVCIGQAVTAKFGERCFSYELAAGTPFTIDGAKELFRLGIITICMPLDTMILAQIISSIVAEFVGCGEAFKLEGGDSVALGAMFLFMSLLCKYGAELNKHCLTVPHRVPAVQVWGRMQGEQRK